MYAALFPGDFKEYWQKDGDFKITRTTVMKRIQELQNDIVSESNERYTTLSSAPAFDSFYTSHVTLSEHQKINSDTLLPYQLRFNECKALAERFITLGLQPSFANKAFDAGAKMKCWVLINCGVQYLCQMMLSCALLCSANEF